LIWLGEPLRSFMHGMPERVRSWLVFDQLHRIGRFLAKPKVGWLSASAALVVWHIPAVFAVGMNSEVLHMFEQWSFLAAGLLFWWPVIQPWPAISTPELSMILYLFFATIPCDILSGFLVFCDRVVYPSYLSSSHLLGFSALGDQQCAAALMWTSVTVIYLIAGVVLTMHLLSPSSTSEHDGLYRGPVVSALHKVEALRGD
jgi:putative membrane protein